MFSEMMESVSLDNMSAQAHKGLDAMEKVISKIQENGVDSLLPVTCILNQ